ncbi:MAG: ADP-ribose pyrophosphatase [Phototrophicales bacterium]|nr:MAG: ADP-ribose pyrophosphatase [Phototrophicales bacterium]
MVDPQKSSPKSEKEQQLVYNGRIVNLYIKHIQLPSGSTVKHEVIEHSGAVAIIPFIDDQRVMLIRQYRPAIGKYLLEIPAGTLEPHENPDDAAIRELREEIGYRANELIHIGGIYVAPGYSTEFIHLYIAKQLVYDPLKADTDELIEAIPMSISEALIAISKGDIQDAKSVVGLLRAYQHK